MQLRNVAAVVAADGACCAPWSRSHAVPLSLPSNLVFPLTSPLSLPTNLVSPLSLPTHIDARRRCLELLLLPRLDVAEAVLVEEPAQAPPRGEGRGQQSAAGQE